MSGGIQAGSLGALLHGGVTGRNYHGNTLMAAPALQ